jgi:DNA polymerase-3 subunit beta
MRIKTSNSELMKTLSNIGKVIPSKSIEPILENVLIRVDEKVKLIATNLEQGIECVLESEIEDLSDGVREVVLPFSLFKDIISKLDMNDITEIELSSKKGVIKQKNASYSLNCFNPEAFAILPQVEEKLSFSLNLSFLRFLIENTIFAASKKEESRKEFKGVLIDSKDRFINFVATDSTALALNKKEVDLPEMNFIIPWKALDIFSKIDPGKDDNVKIISDGNSMKFVLSNLTLITLLINGKFPSYETVIPENFQYSAEVSKDEILKSLKRVDILASKGNERINLTFSNGFLEIESVSTEIGEGKEKIPCNTNTEMALQFYSEKLINGIEHVPSQTVVFGINGPLHPVLVKGQENDSYIYVIMPQKPFE